MHVAVGFIEQPPQLSRRIWYGVSLALGVSLTQPMVAIAAFMADLTGLSIRMGGTFAMLAMTGALPQPFITRWVEPRLLRTPICWREMLSDGEPWSNHDRFY